MGGHRVGGALPRRFLATVQGRSHLLGEAVRPYKSLLVREETARDWIISIPHPDPHRWLA